MEILLKNANLLLLSVIIPFFLMTLFTLIRSSLGNSVTAMPDVLVFLSAVDFYFVLQPDPWTRIVHESLKNAFQALFLAFALLCAIIFILSLSVERRLIRFWIRRNYPQAVHLMPIDIMNQRFPVFRVMGSWFSIGCLVALQVLPFFVR